MSGLVLMLAAQCIVGSSPLCRCRRRRRRPRRIRAGPGRDGPGREAAATAAGGSGPPSTALSRPRPRPLSAPAPGDAPPGAAASAAAAAAAAAAGSEQVRRGEARRGGAGPAGRVGVGEGSSSVNPSGLRPGSPPSAAFSSSPSLCRLQLRPRWDAGLHSLGRIPRPGSAPCPPAHPPSPACPPGVLLLASHLCPRPYGFTLLTSLTVVPCCLHNLSPLSSHQPPCLLPHPFNCAQKPFSWSCPLSICHDYPSPVSVLCNPFL